MPAWTHLLMTCNLLQMFKREKNTLSRWEIVLAAGLLHDVQEDTNANHPATSVPALEKALMEKGFAERDANGIAIQIITIVEELTNLTGDGFDKRLFQVDHANAFSDEAKMVKYAEFCASMIDDILVPSSNTPKQCINFANKSQSIAHAMSKGFEPEAKIAIALCNLAKEYHSRPRDPKEDGEFRRTLLEKVLKRAKKMHLPRSCAPTDFDAYSLEAEDKILGMKMNKSMEVTHFIVAAGPEHHWLISNQFINSMISLVEQDVQNHMYESPADIYGMRCGRCITLEKPIPVAKFNKMVRQAKRVEEVVPDKQRMVVEYINGKPVQTIG